MFVSFEKQNEALISIMKLLQEMQKPEDVPQTLVAYLKKIQNLGLSVFSISVYALVDEAREIFDGFHIDLHGEFVHRISRPERTIEKWKAGRILYRPNIDEELDDLPPNYIHEIQDVTGIRVRSVISFPFSKGLIVYRSQIHNPFSETQIKFLSQACEVLSLVIQRYKILESEDHSERIVRAVVSAINAVPYIRDYSQNEYVYFGEGITQLLGYTSNELTPAIFNGMIRERVILEQGVIRKSEYLVECKNGEQKWLADAAVPVLDDKGWHIESVGILYDITQDKNVQLERSLYQKLAAIGQLSAGVSHNLNNILMGIFGPAQLLQADLAGSPHIADVEAILSAATRAKELVRRLYKSTIPSGEQSLLPVNLNDIITEALTATRSKWKDESRMAGGIIEIVLKLGEICPIKANESELQDGIINLIINAVDAMPNGGEITIQTTMDKDQVRFTFSDSGIGMDEVTMSKIFDPFFTTKGENGTGLGLSTLHNSVQRFGGTLKVDSRPGVGTTFSIVFPVIETEMIPVPKVESKLPKGRQGRILVVEDDPDVRLFVSRLLSSSHVIETVADGRSALEKFQPSQFDVALVDLGLPDITGDKVAKRIREVDHNIALVMITGWAAEYAKLDYDMFDFKFQKPFDRVDALLTIIFDAIALCDSRKQNGD